MTDEPKKKHRPLMHGERMILRTFYLTPTQAEYIRTNGGAIFIRRLITEEMTRQTRQEETTK